MFSSSRRLLIPVLLSAGLLLAACTGGDDDSAGSPTERLATAAQKLADAPALDISLSTSSLPSGQSGLLSANGVGTHAPAFKGKVEVIAVGATVGADVVAVDGKVFAKTGFSPSFTQLDPSSIGAPDPAGLIGATADDGLAGLLSKTEDLTSGDKSRDGKLVLTEITGKIPGKEVAALLPSADDTTDFDVTYRLTDDDVLHDATLTGPFYGGESMSYTVTLKPLGDAPSIEAP